MKIQRCVLLLFFVIMVFIVGESVADSPEYVPSQLIVCFNPEFFSNDEELENISSQLHAEYNATVLRDSTELGIPGAQLLQLPDNVSVEEAIDWYTNNQSILFAEPNYILKISPPIPPSEEKIMNVIDDTTQNGEMKFGLEAVYPNDPYYSKQWNLNKIQLPSAWDLTKGSDSVIIAILDTGVDYTHPDFAGNIWTNPLEVPNNRKDDDNNGFIDDVYGWDFVNNDNSPLDDYGHGTKIASIIGSKSNNLKGLSGILWNVKIMPIKTADSEGTWVSDQVEGVKYAKSKGAKIIVCSFGGYQRESLQAAMIDQSPNQLFVCAAGNDARNTDYYPHYPSSFTNSNIISVAATDNSDFLCWFSNYGQNSVDVAAPGAGIYALGLNSQYSNVDGTSYAGPHVAGLAGLILSINPTKSPSEIRQLIVNNVDKVSQLNGKVQSAGRINAYKTLLAVSASPTPTPTPTPSTSSQYEFLKEWGTSGTSQGLFNKPWEPAVHPTKDRVYVTDTWNHRIQVFTKNGAYLTSWGSQGSGNGQFNYPIGVAINEKLGRVYVSEENGNRIQIFTEDGGYISKWGSYGTGQGQFKDMREISIDKATGNVYVADTGNNRIQVFSSDGIFLRQIGSPGNGNGQLSAPFDVFIDQNTRKIYVTDQTNQRVQIFNENGGYSSQFGTSGTGNGQFTGPTGIAVNSTGYSFVVDQGNYRVQVFSPTGSYVTGWGGYGSSPGQFYAPWGIGLDVTNGYVYVGDSHNNRIQVFKPKYSVSPTPTSPTPTPTTITPTPTQTNPTTLTADFTASKTSGAAPLTVRFQDTSQGNPTGWMWDINGDGFRDYSDRSIEHTYTSPGYYSVTFSITRNQELVTITRPNYIHVLGENPTTNTMTLDLQTGWNLISTPKILAEGHRTRSEVFSGINTAGHSTFRYNAQTQSWTQLNSGDKIQPLMGIWIYSATPVQVSLTFSDNPASSTYELSSGWNSIGFSKVDPVSAKDALLPVQNAWAQVLGFNAASQFYETSIINGGSGTHSDSNLVYPGKGYWVYMNSQGTLS